ncbi:nitroreductase family protein [Desulfolutivibrio sulfodismutans]|nr:nitroreductase family protein [Desulfolutivibrio sulfodismutans]
MSTGAALATPVMPVVVDAALCVGCGLCVRSCPTKTLALEGGKAVVTDQACLTCGHCQAVCPEGAVVVAGLDPFADDFATFETSPDWLAPGKADPGQLIRLMRSRRSVRSYLQRPVPKEALLDLVRAGISAPSGHNSQKWAFTLLPDRPAVTFLGAALARFFRKLNKMAANPLIRAAMRLVGRPELGEYHREHYASVQTALALWDSDGTDRLFHGAPAAIVVTSRPGASCPAEDALLASQNMLLAAHAMGLGTCLIGYAVAAMQHDKKIQESLGIDRGETVYAVVALGYSTERYQRVAGRLRPPVRLFHAPQGWKGPGAAGHDLENEETREP